MSYKLIVYFLVFTPIAFRLKNKWKNYRKSKTENNKVSIKNILDKEIIVIRRKETNTNTQFKINSHKPETVKRNGSNLIKNNLTLQDEPVEKNVEQVSFEEVKNISESNTLKKINSVN
mmetsp:Transcript_14579/g.12833  ORF Transcript_14579/g.12833 Transcript_14579/m.12833 type:complete len:118 (-) Transcript_14579:423-776(-)